MYEEIVEFIAGGSKSSDVAAFQPSDEARQRLSDLIARERESSLTEQETAELDHYLQLEHIMPLAKARARQHIKS